MNSLSSKERMINAIKYEETDNAPCAFMLFFNLSKKINNQERFINEEIKLGIDPFVSVGELEVSIDPQAILKTKIIKENGDIYFIRALSTPAGELTQKIIQSNNWPENENYPFFEDHIVPRAKEIFVKPEQDLEKLKYLLGPFKKADIEKLKNDSDNADKIAKKFGLLQVCGSLGYKNDDFLGADMISWLSGFEEPMTLSIKKPEIIKEYLEIISLWTMSKMEIFLDKTKADLVVRRGWYETTEFWTPESYKNLILPTIKKEAELVHQVGKLYGYIITSAFLPIIDLILESGIDVLIGIDPKEGKGTDIKVVKEKFLNKKKALWGGVSGAITVELGNEVETENAVIEALNVLGKKGGFILSPVDNVREDTENTWKNTYKFINTWKKYR